MEALFLLISQYYHLFLNGVKRNLLDASTESGKICLLDS